MNKLIETTTPNTIETTQTETIETIETIEIVALEDVTGGCARCGCGTPGGAVAGTPLAANWRR